MSEGSVSGTSVTQAAQITGTNSNTVEYAVTLTNPRDYYEFTVDAKNEGTIDGMITGISNKVYENNVEVTILTSEKSNIKKIDIQKFNKEYPTLKIAKTNKFHDRFIVIDNKEMYHLGASIKDLGKKCFGINRIEDREIIEKIINY